MIFPNNKKNKQKNIHIQNKQTNKKKKKHKKAVDCFAPENATYSNDPKYGTCLVIRLVFDCV